MVDGIVAHGHIHLVYLYHLTAKLVNTVGKLCKLCCAGILRKIIKSIPVQSNGGIDVELTCVKVYTGNFAVKVFHSFHIEIYVVHIGLADAVKRNCDIRNNRAVTDGRSCCALCGICYAFFCKRLCSITVWIISVIAKNIQRLSGRSGNHLVGQPHFSIIVHTKICADFLALANQSMVNHVCTVFHLDVVKTWRRFFCGGIRDHFLLDLYTKGIHGRVLYGVGRIGCSGNSIQIVELLGIVHVEACQLLLHALCASKTVDRLVQVHLVIICMCSLEIISCKRNICDTSVLYRHLGGYVVVAELLYLCSADFCSKVQRRISGLLGSCIVDLKISIRRIAHGIYIHAQVNAACPKGILRDSERNGLRNLMVSASVCLRYILCCSNICINGCSGWLHTLVNLKVISIVCKGSNGYASKVCGNLRSSVCVKCQGSEFTRACNCRTVLLQIVGIFQSQRNDVGFCSIKSNSVKSHSSGCLCCRCSSIGKAERICLIRIAL